MKKFFTIFLSFLFIAVLPVSIVYGKGPTVQNEDGANGTEVGTKTSGGKSVGLCEGLTPNTNCLDRLKKAGKSTGVRTALCLDNDGKGTLSCTAIECNDNYAVHLGLCRTRAQMDAYCKTHATERCNTEGIDPVSVIGDNIRNKKTLYGKKFKMCFCLDKNIVRYDCGAGSGTPPIYSEMITNIDSITVLDNTCVKDDSVFEYWNCGSKNSKVYPGGTLKGITEQTICTAQWKACAACEPGEGCNCEVSVVNNECKYTTVPNQGFHIVSGENSRNPICEQTDAAKCKAKNGILDVGTGKCLCNPKIEGAQINMETGECICENNNQEIVNGKCVDKCPEGVSRDVNGECEKCNTAIAEWDGQECKCNDAGKIYNANSSNVSASTCDCPSDKPDYIDGQCVKAGQRQCEEAGGQWKDELCKCKPEDIPGTRFDIDTKKCVCEEAGKELKDNQCVVPTTCPQGATGTYPECDCGEEQEYKQESNTCVKKCPEGASLQDGKCVCTNPDYEMVKEGEVLLCKAKVKIKCPDGSDRPENGMCDCGEGKEYDKENNKCIDKTPLCPQGATGTYPNCECGEYEKYNKEKNICEEDKVKKAEEEYKKAKEKEQSLANRTLTAATTAAMGIGGMELAMGLSEQKADKDAEADMKAYLSTFRCKYTDGKSFKGGPDPIELPGGNDAKIMSYRNEYISLAKDLKERKEALGMKPGIESEEILDKAEMGLYDDENVGITSGNYASLYRATALNSEEDQAKIQAEKDKSANRVKGGAIAVGVGAGVGILGNSLINGKLGEAIKAAKEKRKSKVDTEKTVTVLDVKEKVETLSPEDLEEIKKILEE